MQGRGIKIKLRKSQSKTNFRLLKGQLEFTLPQAFDKNVGISQFKIKFHYLFFLLQKINKPSKINLWNKYKKLSTFFYVYKRNCCDCPNKKEEEIVVYIQKNGEYILSKKNGGLLYKKERWVKVEDRQNNQGARVFCQPILLETLTQVIALNLHTVASQVLISTVCFKQK